MGHELSGGNEVPFALAPQTCRHHVIVTGGSSGIGAAIAELYAEQGSDVSLVARTHARLEACRGALVASFAAHGNRFHAEVADIRDARATSGATMRCEATLGPCDILVVCAGSVEPAAFEMLRAESFAEQIETNLLGAANAVRAVYGGMLERRRGRIVLIGSGAGLVGVFGYTAYCASKFGLVGFAEALRQEAKCAGITVSICFPPDTETPQLIAERPARPVEAAAIIQSLPAVRARAVAAAVIAGAAEGRFAIYVDARTRLLAATRSLIAPLLRRWFDRRIAQARRKPAR